MRATGVVRRIDDLGRVVIPKEIRRTMRIREGDPLEIYTSNNGEVIFKQYSPVGELGKGAHQFAETLNKIGEMPAIICDKDFVVAVSGMSKKEILEQRISSALEESMHSRKILTFHGSGFEHVKVVESNRAHVVVSYPIIANGDVSGAVIFASDDEKAQSTETLEKLAETAASYLGKQLED